MRDYLNADLYRLGRYRPLWVAVGLALVPYLGGAYMLSGPGFSEGRYGTISGVVTGLLPLIVGLGIIDFVYNHDIRAGAMKVAIGRGVSRGRVVLVKLTELVALALVIPTLIYLVCELWNLIVGLTLPPAQHTLLRVSFIAAALQLLIYAGIAACIALRRQETTVSTTVFAVLASGLVDGLLAAIFGQQVLIDLFGDLTRYLPRNASTALANALAGVDALSPAIVIAFALYLVIPALLAYRLFTRTELNF